MKKFFKIVVFLIVAIIVVGLTAWSEQAITYPIVRTMLAAWTMTAVVIGISIMTQKFKAMSRVLLASLAGISMLLAFIPSFGIISWVVKIGCCLTVLAEVLFVFSRITEVKIVDNKILVQ